MFHNTFSLLWPIATLEFGGGGGGPPQLTAAQKRKQHQDELAQKHAMEAMMRTPEIQMPDIPSAPAPTTIPPAPTAQQSDIEDAAQESRQSAAKRYGFLRTTYAGATGGYMSGSTPLGSSNNGARATLG